MRDMAVGKDVIVRADGRDFAIASRTVDGDIFAESIVAANLRPSDAAFPLQILSFQSNAREGKYLVIFAQRCMAVDDHVRMQAATGPQRHIFADDTIRPNDTIGANLRFGMNDRGGRNHKGLKV